MALVYEKHTDDCVYQVKTAGASVRLYSNGVLHSQYNPNQVISGAIWDLLLLPAFLKETPPQKILILGLGGGTLVKMIQHFFPTALIDCIELDKHHIRIAKRFFKVSDVNIVQGDAYAYLKTCNAKYDWIIDDVFEHLSGNPLRQWALDGALYKKCLRESGMLSVNIIDDIAELNTLKSQFSQGFKLMHPLYENEICVLGNQLVNRKAFAENLKAYRLLNPEYKTCRLRYQLRTLK